MRAARAREVGVTRRRPSLRSHGNPQSTMYGLHSRRGLTSHWRWPCADGSISSSLARLSAATRSREGRTPSGPALLLQVLETDQISIPKQSDQAPAGRRRSMWVVPAVFRASHRSGLHRRNVAMPAPMRLASNVRSLYASRQKHSLPRRLSKTRLRGDVMATQKTSSSTPAATTATTPSAVAAKGAKPRLLQEDVPSYSLDQALRVARAIAGEYAFRPTKPVNVAGAMGMTHTSGPFPGDEWCIGGLRTHDRRRPGARDRRRPTRNEDRPAARRR